MISSSRRGSTLRWGRTLLLVAGAVLVQVSVLDQLRFDGLFRLDLPLALLVVIAVSSRVDDAALVGFATGLLLDLFGVGPFGRQALVHCVAALVVVGLSRHLATLRTGSVSAGFEPSARRFADRAALALTAGTTTALVAPLLVLVSALAVPAAPDVGALFRSVPYGALAGSVVIVQVVVPIVRRVGVHRASAAAVRSWSRTSVPIDRLDLDARRRSPSPIRRL